MWDLVEEAEDSRGNEEMELRVDSIELGTIDDRGYVKKKISRKKWNLDSKVNKSFESYEVEKC